MLISSIGRVFLFMSCALAAKPLKHEVCGASCYYSLLKIKYANENKTQVTACTNPLRVTSTYYCMGIHCSDADVEPGIKWWAGTCKQSKKLVNLDRYHATLGNVTDAFLASLPTVNLKEKDIIDGPAVPSAESWLVVHRSVSTYDQMRHYHNSVRWVPYGYWAIVLIIGMVYNARDIFKNSKMGADTAISTEGPRSQSKKHGRPLNRAISWFKSNIILAPTFAYHHNQPLGWFNVPLRLQTLVILGYIVVHAVVIGVHYPLYDENYYYETRRIQHLRYLADRLAILVTGSTPLLFLFVGRRNLFISLTGWGFRTFNVFHKWIGIVIFIEGVLHGSVMSAFEVNNAGWTDYRENLAADPIWHYGVLLGVTLGITVVVAHPWVRRHVYELFKAIHVVLAAVFLAALYYHVQPQFRGKYTLFVWLCVAFWSTDHISRVGYLLLLNLKSLMGRGSPATASYSEDTEMIRLQVYSPTPFPHQTPGTYYYLHFPGWRVWESHPFSLAGWSERVTEQQSSAPGDDKEMEPPQMTGVSRSESEPHLTFLIRPRKGMTKRLRDQLSRSEPSSSQRLRVLLEGPYGTPARLGRFQDILFVVGGSGITAVLPYLNELLDGSNSSTGRPNVQLSWAVRSESLIEDVLANDLKVARTIASNRLRQDYYVTSESTSLTSSDVDVEKAPTSRRVRFIQSKPNIEALVENFTREAEGRTAVFVCGPAGMSDDTRAAVIQQVQKGRDVELFEEMYGW